MSSFLVDYLKVTLKPSNVILALAIAAVTTFIAKVVYRLQFHRLRDFPGPKLWAAFEFPYLWAQFRGTSVHGIRALHDKYGPVVRIAPESLSFTTAQAFRDIYASKPHGIQLQKDEKWFVDHAKQINIIKSNDEDHANIRRSFAPAFSEQALREQESLLAEHGKRLVVKLQEQVDGPQQGRVNMTKWYNFLTFDLIGDFAMGEDFGALATGTYHSWISSIFESLKMWGVMRFANYYMICDLALKSMMALNPAFAEMRDAFFKLPYTKVEKRMAIQTDRKDLTSYLIRYNDKHSKLTKEMMCDTACIFIVGGSETTATALCGITYHLLSSPEAHAKLKNEVRSAFKSNADISLQSLGYLKYLAAVVDEGLRLYPPSPAILPRRTGKQGTYVDGFWVPEDISVGCHQFATHHSYRNFADPDKFVPERWIPAQCPEKYAHDEKDAAQPFHLGPRGCIGKNLAFYELRSTIARMVFNFDIELCEQSKNWLSQNVYMVWDKPALEVKLTHASHA